MLVVLVSLQIWMADSDVKFGVIVDAVGVIICIVCALAAIFVIVVIVVIVTAAVVPTSGGICCGGVCVAKCG